MPSAYTFAYVHICMYTYKYMYLLWTVLNTRDIAFRVGRYDFANVARILARISDLTKNGLSHKEMVLAMTHTECMKQQSMSFTQARQGTWLLEPFCSPCHATRGSMGVV